MLKDKICKWLLGNKLETMKAEIDRTKELVTPLFDVGTDVGFGDDHSWAVICIQGKPEYVKFIPLDHKDTFEIIDFLRRFQRSKHIIDSPICFREMIRKEVFIK